MVMRTRGWLRLTARTVLVAFTTCSVACGGSSSREVPATTTVTAVEVATTTVPPPTMPAPSPTLPAQPPQQLGKQELRELVAPVALYPDVVLASLMPATTNPGQVHDAALFVGRAERVDRIPDDRGWDGSVVGLLQFPDVLRWLDENPAWTEEMGQAVTYQQGDVLDAVQDYRRAALDVGNLKSNQYQTVRAAPDRDVRIEPARPDVVYVPSYDPVVATQPQPPAASPGINPWIVFGGGAVVGALGAWALYSIFDDDDEEKNYYYGGGRRRIRGYDDYYYARGRRSRPVDWKPRQRPYRQPGQGWQRTRRLEHVAPSTRPTKKSTALRPPMTHSGAGSPRPGEVRRERRQEHKQERQTQRQEQQQQRQERQQQQRQKQQAQRQQKQQQQREQRQKQQAERQQKQQQLREQRRQQNQDEPRAGDGQKSNAKKKKQQQQQGQQ